ncbi:MAG: branched-chain amino acid ABC transporter permease [Clostridia bacterium]|nr:branched-chain amino acid ABC transporter permease [Clostridia bacterium]
MNKKEKFFSVMKKVGTGAQKFSKNYLNYTVILAVMLVFTIFALATPMKDSTALLFQKITVAVILAVSLNFVVGFLGELSLGHAGFMAVGAFLGGKLSTILVNALGANSTNIFILILSLVLGAVCAAVCGVVVGFAALRLRGDYLAIVTLAFGEIVRVVFINSSYDNAINKINATKLPEFIKNFFAKILELLDFGGALGLQSPSFPKKKMYILVIIGFLLILFTLFVIQNILKSKTGRAITAIRDNEIAAKAMGIDVTKHKLMVFVISAAFAGMAGVLFSYANKPVSASSFGYNYSIEILIMVVLGGMGSINGSIISASLITILNEFLSKKLTGDNAIYKDLFYAVILILVIIYNNAPALKNLREKLNLKNLVGKLFNKIFKRKPNPSSVASDAARWDVVPTKIEMNEVLSTDVVIDYTGENSADIDERGGSDNGKEN